MADIAPIVVAKKYAGIGVSLVARIKNTKTPFSIDFDGATLTEVLRKTFENRGHTFTAEQFEQVMAFDSDDAIQKKWKAFVRKIDTKTDDYGTVLRMIKEFLTEPVTAVILNDKFTKSWSANDNNWIHGGNNNG